MRKLVLALIITVVALVGCNDDHAKIVNQNLSKAADSFEVHRRIVFFNGITDNYLLEIQGLCSVETSQSGHVLHVLCQVGRSEFKKHMLGLSDNVSFFVEQIDSNKVNKYHYRVNFKPQSIIPDIRFQGSSEALGDALLGE